MNKEVKKVGWSCVRVGVDDKEVDKEFLLRRCTRSWLKTWT